MEGFDFQVVSIVGEQVSFVPTKLSPLETAIVFFDEFYRPEGMSEEDFGILKNTMKYLFSAKQKPIGESKETTRSPYPPCQEKEKALVLQSLLHRKRVLQQQLFDLGIILYPEQLQKKLNELRNKGDLDSMLRRKQALPVQGKETLLGDAHLEHWLALDTFIRDYDKQAVCIDVLDIGDKGVKLDLTDDQIKELLQQFVFFMLQGSHPLPEYKKTDPTSPAFISRLKKNPMGDKFPTYLTTYKSKKLPIAPTIARVLEATNVDPAAMRDEVTRQVAEEKRKILLIIKRIIPRTDPIWESVGDENNIGRIIDALYVKIQEQQARIQQLERELAALDTQKKACDKEQALLIIQKRRLDVRITKLSAELAAAQDSDLAKTRRIEELDEKKRELEERLRVLQTQLEAAAGKDAIIAQLRREKQEVEDQLTQANLDLVTERENVTRLTEERDRCNEALAGLREELERERGKDARIEELTGQIARMAREIETLTSEVEAGKGKNAKIAELTRFLSDERAAKKTLEDELAAARRRIEELEALVAAARGKNEKIAGQERELAALRLRTTELEDSLAQKEKRIDELQRQVEEGKGKNIKIQALEEELAALKLEKAGLLRELEELRATLERDKGKNSRIADLERSKGTLESRLAELEAELGPLRGAAADLANLRREVDAARAEFDRRIAELQRQKEECEAAKADLEPELERLQFENQDLKGEIYRLRSQNEELDDLLKQAQTNIEELKRTHQAQIATEKSKTLASEAARTAAVKAAETASTNLATKTSELASARASLESTTTLLATKEKTIGDLTKALKEQEAALENARGEITKRDEDIRRLSTEALAAKDEIEGLKNTIADLREAIQQLQQEKELVELDLESKLEQIATFERQLAEALAKQRDLTTALAKCEEEKRNLLASASGAATSTAELAGRLRVAEEERAAAQAKVAELEATIAALRRQVGSEKERADTAEERARQQGKKLEEHEETIKYFEQDIAQKQGELDKVGKKAEDCEGKVGELEARVASTIAQKDEEINAVKTELQDGYQQQLADQQSEFEKTLQNEKKALQDSFIASATAAIQHTQEEYEAALQQQKENYEKVYAVIQRMATWVDSGEERGVEEAADIKADTPQAGPLRTIVTKLGEVHGAASGSASPTARKTADSTINLCYIVFLATFLWQTNFPPHALEAESRATSSSAAGDGVSEWEALHSNKPLAVVPHLKLLHAILPTVFDGGAKPTKETWATSTSSPASYAFRQGLYRDIEMRSAGATTKHEFHGHLYSENTIVRRFLHLFNKISRAMESPHPDGSILGLDDIDIVFLDQLVAKLTTIITDYKDVYRTPTFHLETAFPHMISDTLRMNQPLVKPDILKHYLVKTRAGYRIVTKDDKEEAPSYLNYATIFYCFLVVIRDYLNHIEGTVYAQCPLPAILRRTKSRK